jgi:VWFA-related protein
MITCGQEAADIHLVLRCVERGNLRQAGSLSAGKALRMGQRERILVDGGTDFTGEAEADWRSQHFFWRDSMKTIGLTLIILLSLTATIPAPARAQQSPADLSVRVVETDASAFPQVALSITVRDANGVHLPGVDQSAFEVNEDRAPEARPIAGVQTMTNHDLPVGLVLAVDISGSMAGEPLADAQAAARTLVEQLGEEDEIAFIAFADAVDLDGLNPAREHPPTSDRRVVMALIDGLAAEGGTPLYDALYKGVQWVQEGTLGHRAVILLTDGVDEDPGSAVASAETPIQEATRANVPVFTIGLGSEIDAGYLERVARTTGGTYQETPDSGQLGALFLNVLDRLKQQYVITYESGLPADGETHRVSVSVELDGRQAQDEAELGPLPLAVTPTASPTEVPTATPVPTMVPTATTVAVSLAGQNEATPWPPWSLVAAGGGGLLAVILLAIAVSVRRRRAARQEYCAGCGRALGSGDTCPDCGADVGRFRRPE